MMLNKIKFGLIITLFLALSACGGNKGDDLDQFMANAGKNMSTSVAPLPEVKPYEPLQFNADHSLNDPFKPRKVSGKLAPNLNRTREPLEGYPLESLKYVGSLSKSKLIYALIKTTDGNVQQIKIGNYLGANYGLVIQITDAAVILKELVLDQASGDWIEQVTTMSLQEAEGGK